MTPATTVVLGKTSQVTFAHLAAASADWGRLKHQGAAYQPTELLPAGPPPVTFAKLAGPLKATQLEDVPVPDDLVFALRKTFDLGERATAWRRKTLRELRDVGREFRAVQAALGNNRSPNNVSISSHFQLGLFAAAVTSMGWPDVELLHLLSEGAHLVGAVPSIGSFRSADVPAGRSVADLLQAAEAWTDEVMRRPPPPLEQCQLIEEKASQEVRSGVM